MGLRIRIAGADDVPAIVAGYSRATGIDVDSVAGRAARGEIAGCDVLVVAFDPRGRVRACLGARTLRMRVRGRERIFACWTRCFIDPVYRIGGVHGLLTELDDAFRHEVESAAEIGLVFARFEYEDAAWFRARRSFGSIRTGIELRRAIMPIEATERVAERTGHGEVEVVDALDAIARDDAWTLDLLDGDSGRIRDAGSLARDLERTGETAAAWCVLREGRVVGLALAREDGDGGRTLLDWFTFERDIAAAHALVDAVSQGGTLSVRFPVWTRSRFLLRTMQSLGFGVYAGSERCLYARLSAPGLNEQWISENLTLTAIDAGDEDLVRLASREVVVTPAPPGTTSARSQDEGRRAAFEASRRKAERCGKSSTAGVPASANETSTEACEAAPSTRFEVRPSEGESAPEPVAARTASLSVRTVRSAARIAGRSLFPITALVVIGGTMLWGPWVSLVLAYSWWRVVARVG